MDAERIANLVTFTIFAILGLILVLTGNMDAQVMLGFLVGGSLPSPNATISAAVKARQLNVDP